MSREKYRINGLGMKFFVGVVLSSTLAFASFKNIDCLKDRAMLGISSNECYVLEKLWESTDGENWYEHENWDSLSEVSSWEGIQVDEGRVSALLLHSNNLKGTIPNELGKLSNLKRLALNNNKLSENIPISLGELSNLNYLALNNNMLNGDIPVTLGSDSGLKELYLNNNNLSNNIPDSLGNLNNLIVLKLYENNLSGEIPATLGRLSSLDVLSLSENNLRGSIPVELGRLSKLTYLDLKSNQLSGSIPSSLSYLSSLTGLYLQKNQLEGIIPTEIGSLPNLIDLDLSENKLSGVIPKSMGALGNLTYLNLAKNKLSGTISTELVSLSHLNYFNIEENHFANSDMKPILAELSYIPNYSITSQFSSDNNQVVEHIVREDLTVKHQPKRLVEEEQAIPEPSITSTVIQVIKSADVAFFELDTLKIVGTENFGDSLEVKREGKWSIGEDGKIIFTALAELEGNPTDIAYTIEDNDGTESEPVTVSIHYALPKEINGSSTLVFNLLKEQSHDIQSVEILSSEYFQQGVEYSELSRDKKELRVEGEGLWKIEKSGKLTFVPEEGFFNSPTSIMYLFKGENKSTIGTVDIKETSENKIVSTFSSYGLLLMMILSGLLGLFYLRKINEEESIK